MPRIDLASCHYVSTLFGVSCGDNFFWGRNPPKCAFHSKSCQKNFQLQFRMSDRMKTTLLPYLPCLVTQDLPIKYSCCFCAACFGSLVLSDLVAGFLYDTEAKKQGRWRGGGWNGRAWKDWKGVIATLNSDQIIWNYEFIWYESHMKSYIKFSIW